LNRIDPRYLDLSPVLDELVSIVPFGIDVEEGGGEEADIRDHIPQIKEGSILMIWGGVISNWFDPVTLIRALKKALEKNPNIQLLFLSTTHPNPLLPELDMAKEAIRVSDELGMTDKQVIFNRDWVDYDKRGSYFSGADIGLSIHKVHFETHYSFRTRILDYLKYDLPIICTKGDYFAELVQERGLGISVNPENEEELAAAILNLADEDRRVPIKEKLREEKKQFYWDRVSRPLVQYCQKVLNGEVKKKNPTSKKDLVFLFTPRRESAPRSFVRSAFWHVFQRFPLRLAVRLKRLFKF
jgi:glycosyltransferase involved in cell wall biosynthesis